jgi:hypothetical protein
VTNIGCTGSTGSVGCTGTINNPTGICPIITTSPIINPTFPQNPVTISTPFSGQNTIVTTTIICNTGSTGSYS